MSYRNPHLSSVRRLFTFRFVVWWMVASALTFGLSADAWAQQKRPTPKPIIPGKRAITPTQQNSTQADDALPNGPAIEAESRRLAARRAAEERKLESELISKNNPAQTRSEDLLRKFRQTFPFHSQVVALSDAAADGSRTLIVSEPPPHVTTGDILMTIGDGLLLNHQVKKHPIGYDGWVKDVAIAVKGNDEALQVMLSRLHQRLFFTSYKSYTLKLPAIVRATQFDLDLTVTPEEIKRWVVDEREQFFPVEGGNAETLTTLSTEHSSGVYISKRRGLVGWWIPKTRHIYECRVQARQFALDADLVLGAIANRSGMFVLGRERIVPVDILPPLRIETLTLLADVQDGQRGMLAQSYERNHPFAGRVADGKDWAPILLSPELRDTEYGSLLNITDQLLKGWSNHGETLYINFDYPTPQHWPFAAPLSQMLKARELTYNWNTKGVGYAISFGTIRILALNRTGSLPVSYIPDGMDRGIAREVNQAQETGYNYFSGLSDPNLVRVAQYAAMYQIFSAFDIARSSRPVPADRYPGELIESLTTNLYAELRRASDDELNSLARQIAPLFLDRKSAEERIAPGAAEKIERFKREIDAELQRRGFKYGSKQYNEKFDQLLTLIEKRQTELIERGIAMLYQSITEGIKRELGLIKLDRPAKSYVDQSMRRMILSGVASIKRLPQLYAEAVGLRARGWIHTPVVVLSWDKGGRYIGGHNIDARVTKVVTDEAVPVGQVRIDARGLIVNPKDASRARSLVRNIERNELMLELARAVRDRNPAKFASVQAEIGDALARAEAVAVRPRETALGFSAPPPNKPPNKPPVSTAGPGPAGGAGWEGGGRKPILVVTERRDKEAIRVKLRENGRHDLEYGIASEKESFGLKFLTHEDMVDVVVVEAARRARNGEPVVIEFGEMPEHKALATLRTMETRLAQQGRAVELVGFRSGEGLLMGEPKIIKWQEASGHRIGVAEVDALPGGRLRQDVVLEVRTPNQSGRSRVQIFFDRLTPLNVISAVRERVVRAINGLAKQFRPRNNVSAYNKQLARAIKKIKVRTKLDFEFSVGEQQGLRDIYIGQKGRAYGESATDASIGASTCQSE
jgi:hypothetical protein